MNKELLRSLTLSAAVATSPFSFENEIAAIPETGNDTTVTAFINTNEIELTPEQKRLEEVRHAIESFTWKDFEDDKRLNKFIGKLAQGYIDSTEISFHTKKELKNYTQFFRSSADLREESKKISPEFPAPESLVGITYELTKDGYIDKTHYLVNLEEIDNFLDRNTDEPGYFLADELYKAWMLEDTILNFTEGELIENPDFKIEELNENEVIGYFGGSILAENENYSLNWFNENLAHAISSRFLEEKVGLDSHDLSKGYGKVISEYTPQEKNVLVNISIMEGVSVDELYEYYSVSNAEEIYKMIGRHMMYVEVENDELNRFDFDQDLFNGFRYAQVIDRGFEYPELEVDKQDILDTTRLA